MSKLYYNENKDATQPIGTEMKYIAHVCNNIGAWGAGFVLAISNRWSAPEKHYLNLKPSERKLGNTHFIQVESDIIVVNMIAQNGLRTTTNPTPLDYYSLAVCLETMYNKALIENATVHMPKIGSGLGGGDWNKIENIIKEKMKVDTHIYTL